MSSFFFLSEIKGEYYCPEQAGRQAHPTDAGLFWPQCSPFNDFRGSQSTINNIYDCLFFSAKARLEFLRTLRKSKPIPLLGKFVLYLGERDT